MPDAHAEDPPQASQLAAARSGLPRSRDGAHAIEGYSALVEHDPATDHAAPGTPSWRRMAWTAIDRPAITSVRHRFVEQLTSAGWVDTQDAALVFSELVTNAVLHADGAVEVTIVVDGHAVRIDVHDRAVAQPRMRTPDSTPGGLGLHIVDRLSSHWGTEPTATGKCVWAVVPAPAS
jgi:anti-sigma regulatory factor (Ser/Thr protein kinase)